MKLKKGIISYFSIKKLFLLLSVGLPGLSKLLVAFLIKQTQGLLALGDYANDMNVALIVGAVTGAGFSVIVMNRAPVLFKSGKERELLGRVFFLSIFISILSVPILLVLNYFEIIVSWQYVLLFLLGYSIYQVFKHYLMAFKLYFKIVMYELLVLITICIGILSLKNWDALFVHGIILILFFGILTLSVATLNVKKLFDRKEIRSGFGFGFSNLSSTFLSLISVPLAKQFLGPLYAGLLGLINPIIQIIIIVPRSLGVFYLPEIVKNRASVLQQCRIHRTFSKVNIVFLLLSMAVLGFLWIAYQLVAPSSEIVLEHANVVLLLIILNVFTSQISLPLFTFLSAWDMSKLSFIINFTMLCYFLCCSPIILKFNKGFIGFCMIYILLIVGNLVRFLYLKRRVSRTILKA